MAVTQSTQLTKTDANPRVELSVREKGGRIRVARFDYAVPPGGLSIADQLELCDLPTGARIIAGLSTIRSSGGPALGTINIGTRAHVNAQTGAAIPENATRFASGQAADPTPYFKTFAALTGAMPDDTDVILGQCRVFLTFMTSGPVNGQKLRGEIAFIVD
jgi:hypothetical protein